MPTTTRPIPVPVHNRLSDDDLRTAATTPRWLPRNDAANREPAIGEAVFAR
jgi:hypothetical protein